MEALGLLLGLAPLFSICLEYFEYFNTAQALSPDLEVLLLKIDFEHERFIAWGEANGISKPAGEGRNSELDSPSKHNLIKRGLECIETMFKNGEKLQAEYGVSALDETSFNEPKPKFPSSSGLYRFRKSYAKLLKRTKTQLQPGLLSRTRWAIHDKTKFTALISDVRELVNGLYHVLPVTNKERDKIVFRDIRALLPDLERLRLVETASEETYPAWSEAASLIIVASESGTAYGQGSIGKWVEELDDSTESESGVIGSTGPPFNQGSLRFDISSRSSRKIYFVFTSKCSSIYSGNCNETTMGLQSVGTHALNFFPVGGLQKTWSLGKRITKDINPSFSPEDHEVLRQFSYDDISELQKLAIESSLPSQRVDIFCAPCPCAIRTAVSLCLVETTRLISYITKVDDRIPASCCAESTKLQRLNTLLSLMQEYDAGELMSSSQINSTYFQFIDRVWLEQRIFHLETEFYTPELSKTDHSRVAELLKTLPPHNVVVLGEVDRCLWILQTKPFPWTPRMPKENEIYSLVPGNSNPDWSKNFLGSFTPRNFVANAASVQNRAASETMYSRVSKSATRSPQLQMPLSPSPNAKYQKPRDSDTESPTSSSQRDHVETAGNVLSYERATNLNFPGSLTPSAIPKDPPHVSSTQPHLILPISG